MSGYIIEEPEETPTFYNTSTEEETTQYWKLYSNYQHKRFKKVLRQLNETWYSVYNSLKFIRDYGVIDIEGSNYFMINIHKLFIVEHKNKIEFYNQEKINKRLQKGYLNKRINKLRLTKNKV